MVRLFCSIARHHSIELRRCVACNKEASKFCEICNKLITVSNYSRHIKNHVPVNIEEKNPGPEESMRMNNKVFRDVKWGEVLQLNCKLIQYLKELLDIPASIRNRIHFEITPRVITKEHDPSDDMLSIRIQWDRDNEHFMGFVCLYRNNIVYLDNGQMIEVVQGYIQQSMIPLGVKVEGNLMKKLFGICAASITAFVQNLYSLEDSFARDVSRSIVQGTDTIRCIVHRVSQMEDINLTCLVSKETLMGIGCERLIWRNFAPVGTYVAVKDAQFADTRCYGRITESKENLRVIEEMVVFDKSISNESFTANIHDILVITEPSVVELFKIGALERRDFNWRIRTNIVFSFEDRFTTTYLILLMLYRLRTFRVGIPRDYRSGRTLLKIVESIFVSFDRDQVSVELFESLHAKLSRNGLGYILSTISSEMFTNSVFEIHNRSGAILGHLLMKFYHESVQDCLVDLCRDVKQMSTYLALIVEVRISSFEVPETVDVHNKRYFLQAVVVGEYLFSKCNNIWMCYSNGVSRKELPVLTSVDCRLILYSTEYHVMEYTEYVELDTPATEVNKLLSSWESTVIVDIQEVDDNVEWSHYQSADKHLIFIVSYSSIDTAQTELSYIVYKVERILPFGILSDELQIFVFASCQSELSNLQLHHKENTIFITDCCRYIDSYRTGFNLELIPTVKRLWTMKDAPRKHIPEFKHFVNTEVVTPFKRSTQRNKASLLRRTLEKSSQKIIEDYVDKYPFLKNHTFQKPLQFEVSLSEKRLVSISSKSLDSKDAAKLLLDSNSTYSGFGMIQKETTELSTPTKLRSARKTLKEDFREHVSVVLDDNGLYYGMIVKEVDTILKEELNNSKIILDILNTTRILKDVVKSKEIGLTIDYNNGKIELHTILALSFDGVQLNRTSRELFMLRWMVRSHPHALENYHLVAMVRMKESHNDIAHILRLLQPVLMGFEGNNVTTVTMDRHLLENNGIVGFKTPLVELSVRSTLFICADLVAFQHLYNISFNTVEDTNEVLPWMKLTHADRLRKEVLNRPPILELEDIRDHWRAGKVPVFDIPTYRCIPCVLHLILRECASDVAMIRYKLGSLKKQYDKQFCRLLKDLKIAKNYWYPHQSDYSPETMLEVERFYSDHLLLKYRETFSGTPCVNIDLLESLEIFSRLIIDLRCVDITKRRDISTIVLEIQRRCTVRSSYIASMNHNAYYELVLTQIIPFYFTYIGLPMLGSQEGHENCGKQFKHRVTHHSPKGGGRFNPEIEYTTTSGGSYNETLETMNDYVVLFDYIQRRLAREVSKRSYLKRSRYWDCKSKNERKSFAHSTTLFNNKRRRLDRSDNTLMTECDQDSSQNSVGLQNIGNTCFVNALVSFMSNLSLVTSADSDYDMTLARLMRIYQGHKNIEHNLYENLRNLLPYSMLDNNQHDVFELFNHIMNSVSSDASAPFRMESRRISVSTNSTSSVSSYSLSLPISKDVNNGTLIFKDLNDMLSAECCDSSYETIYPIVDNPKYMVIHLMRWKQTSESIRKIDTDVNFDLTIDISRYLSADNVSVNTLYNIKSIICHEGNVEEGHYYSFISNSGYWYKCDDRDVELVDIGNIFQSANTCYLLCYERDDSIYTRKEFTNDISDVDLSTLSSRSWLNDNIIYFSLKLYWEELNQENESYLLLPTFLYSSYVQFGYNSIIHILEHIRLFSKKLVQIPININGNHWCGVSFLVEEQRLIIHDSLHNYRREISTNIMLLLKEYFQCYMQMDLYSKISITCSDQMQNNGYDCGVYLISSFRSDVIDVYGGPDDHQLKYYRYMLKSDLLYYRYRTPRVSENLSVSRQLIISKCTTLNSTVNENVDLELWKLVSTEIFVQYNMKPDVENMRASSCVFVWAQPVKIFVQEYMYNPVSLFELRAVMCVEGQSLIGYVFEKNVWNRYCVKQGVSKTRLRREHLNVVMMRYCQIK